MSNNPHDIAAFRCVESVGFAFGALSLKTLCFFPMAFKETLSFGKKKLKKLCKIFPSSRYHGFRCADILRNY